MFNMSTSYSCILYAAKNILEHRMFLYAAIKNNDIQAFMSGNVVCSRVWPVVDFFTKIFLAENLDILNFYQE